MHQLLYVDIGVHLLRKFSVSLAKSTSRGETITRNFHGVATSGKAFPLLSLCFTRLHHTLAREFSREHDRRKFLSGVFHMVTKLVTKPSHTQWSASSNS